MKSCIRFLDAPVIPAFLTLAIASSIAPDPLAADSYATRPLLTAAASPYPHSFQRAASSAPRTHLVPLFPSTRNNDREGFVRLINRSGRDGEVSIVAIGDSGSRSPEIVLAVNANETVHFNSRDLEDGNPQKGLARGTGTAGEADRRLELTSELDLEVLAYIRTDDGFLTAMHDVVERSPDGYRVAIFNPARNSDQVSLLRLINPGAEDAEIRITGTDDAGALSAVDSDTDGAVRLSLPAGRARTVSAAELESGPDPGEADTGGMAGAGAAGALGTGTGKWQLAVTSGQPIVVLSLLQSRTGRLTNLSTAPSAMKTPPPVARDPILDRLRLPEGFEIRIVSADVRNARQMALAADGTLFAGTLRSGQGRVYAIPDALTRREPEVVVLAEGLRMPSGVAERGGDLYVAALNRILRYNDIGERLAPNAAHELVTDALPDAPHHGWKYIKFGPDGRLYVPVGAPCNICLSEQDPRFASLLGMDPASGATEIVAHGVRNTVGFAWHPESGQLWFSDNGRDYMGDDLPPEEFNVITRIGEHFGYPYVHATDILDPDFGRGVDPADYTPPVVEIQAHSAALGVDFYTQTQFPARYRNALFVAEHGSWNRSSKVGYQVGVIVFPNGQPRYEAFITGWLDRQSQRNWGRPNDVLAAPDGSLLISDDQYGAIYQVTYTGK